MTGFGYTSEYTEDETNRQNSDMVGETEAVGGSSPDDRGEILSEGETTVEQMLKISQGDVEEETYDEEEEPAGEYNFAEDDNIAHLGIGYGLVGKPDYDLE